MRRIILCIFILLSGAMLNAGGRRTPVITDSELLFTLGDLKTEGITFRGSPQGFAIYGNTAVLIRDGGQVNVIDLKKKVLKAVYDTAVDNGHCNNAGFGKEKAYKNSLYPMLYVSECYGKRRCFVLNLEEDGARVVQQIFYEDPDYKGPLDWAVDAKNGFIYAYGGPESGRFLKRFRLPRLSDSDAEGCIRFTAGDVLSTVTFTGVRIPQGSLVRGRYAYIPDGCPPEPTVLHIIDMTSGQKLLEYSLSGF